MKKWKNISLNLPAIDLKDASDKLSDLDIVSFTIKDRRDEQNSDWVDDPNLPKILTGDHYFLTLMVESQTNIKKLITQVQSCLKLKEKPIYFEEVFEDKDWVKHTQSLFKEIEISDSLRIIPPWESESPFDGQSIIIQPGSGFGTGSHPTTRLCLRWLENNIKKNESVLDFGCGSGILSIGAKMLGAGDVVGVEIDHLAINNANQNNELNSVSISYHEPDNFETKQKYDIVIANILSSILIRLAPTLGPLINNKIILSGILVEQAEMVIKSYSEWVNLSVLDEMDGWVLLSN
ncbi:MAG: 50S ribosomal protein L11 methyltransferase [Candidatus Marinimicrobia bacterium]|nr:50S ribosomal protein L11 methyltransferase [Candidatus Neomarinimicrobiota bacterium]